MSGNSFNIEVEDIAWCPGCGNFPIRNILIQALEELELKPEKTVLVSGIGQAAKMPHYVGANLFNGLHGRALPPAAGIKASNPTLTVIAESGDGDMYGEGGNHFIHCIRRNPDITNLIHDNQVYGLTKGQASPTSPAGFKTPVQVKGVLWEPFNPLAVAISLNASFVARAYCGDQDKTREIIKKAIQHRGYALVDILQPCVSFNKVNTYGWYGENTYYLDEKHDVTDRNAAFSRACETEKLPLGVFYEIKDKPTFEDNLGLYEDDDHPLFERCHSYEKLREKIKGYGE